MEVLICSKINYAFSFEVESVENNNVTLKTGYSLKKLDIVSAQLTRGGEDTDAGRTLTEKLEITAILTESQFKYLSAYPLVIQLQLIDSTTKVVGTPEIPARFESGIFRLYRAEFTIKRSSDLLNM